jgi:hypothetical protein
MSTTQKILCVPYWLAVLMGILGCVVTFVPGAECEWFGIVAALSLFGLFIPKFFYRGAATLLLVLSILAAMNGHQRGIKYRQWLATHQVMRNDQITLASMDSISRFVAEYPNIEGISIAYHSTGVPSSMDPHEAIEKLRQTGIRQPPITNLTLIELRELHPEDRDRASLLTNSIAALVDTEIGKRIVLLKASGDWWYHVYDLK